MLAMITPVIYGYYEVTFQFILGFVLFFPVFYLVIEFIDDIVPDPKAVRIDEGKESMYAGPR